MKEKRNDEQINDGIIQFLKTKVFINYCENIVLMKRI